MNTEIDKATGELAITEKTHRLHLLFDETFSSLEKLVRRAEIMSITSAVQFKREAQDVWAESRPKFMEELTEQDSILRTIGTAVGGGVTYKAIAGINAYFDYKWDWENADLILPKPVTKISISTANPLTEFSVKHQTVEGVAQAGGYDVGMTRDTVVELRSAVAGRELIFTQSAGRLLTATKREYPTLMGAAFSRVTNLNLQLLD
jgi:hypothetical protein